jgi:Cof subfamily protein (haloacid dehalogenase superfamily)
LTAGMDQDRSPFERKEETGTEEGAAAALFARPYDLVALDVDGTLLNSRLEISPENRAAVQAARQAGLRPILVSGRPTLTLRKWLELLDLQTSPYISSGGACVCDPARAIPIAEYLLPPEAAETLVRVGRAAGLSITKANDRRIVYEGSSERLQQLYAIERIEIMRVPDILQVAFAPTKVTLIGEPEQLAPVEAHLRSLALPIYLTYSLPFYLEATRAGVNKGTALKTLAEYLAIPMERIVAIGDQQNDISMLKVAGLGVAVANAPPAVRAAADLVAPSNDENGVAWLLWRLIAHRARRQRQEDHPG